MTKEIKDVVQALDAVDQAIRRLMVHTARNGCYYENEITLEVLEAVVEADTLVRKGLLKLANFQDRGGK